jgi:membrane protein
VNLSVWWNRLVRFLQHDIWLLPAPGQKASPSNLKRLLRIVVLAGRGFFEKSLQLRASALVYLSLLSIVPVVALAFGVAKGFGLEAALEQALREQLAGQEDIFQRITTFAHTMLDNTKGGIVAGFGVVLLLWAVVRLMGNIEKSFNVIWGVERGRSPVRMLTDYLAIATVAPILLLLSSSAAVFISGGVQAALAKLGVYEPVGALVKASLGLVPYVFIWLLLTFLYLTMPNTRVSWKAGLAAGVVAGTMYQLLQIGYIQFQFGVSRYNAIYGSFAALPLFLIWLHFSWLIVLMGAEVSFAVDNAGDYARERDAATVSQYHRRLLAVALSAVCAGRFLSGRPPASAAELAAEMKAPTRLVHAVLNVLVHAGVLVEVLGSKPRKTQYQPAHNPADMTLVDIAEAYDRAARPDGAAPSPTEEEEIVSHEALGEAAVRWRALAESIASSKDNLSLLELVEAESVGADDRKDS